MKKPLPPETDTPVKKIWKDNVWGSVIAGIITTVLVSVGGYLLLGITGVFAGEDTEETATVSCTSTGDDVCVRNGEGLQYDTLFQVSKGEYFRIIGTGKKDVVHEKAGRWKHISYGGKEGWMFSAYMRCE